MLARDGAGDGALTGGFDGNRELRDLTLNGLRALGDPPSEGVDGEVRGVITFPFDRVADADRGCGVVDSLGGHDLRHQAVGVVGRDTAQSRRIVARPLDLASPLLVVVLEKTANVRIAVDAGLDRGTQARRQFLLPHPGRLHGERLPRNRLASSVRADADDFFVAVHAV